MSSGRRKEPLNRKKCMIIAAVVIIALLCAVILIRVLRDRVSSQFGNGEEIEVLTAEVTSGSISTTVSGSGTLTNETSDEIKIPDTVEVTSIYVKSSDTVEAGEMLASVNIASLMETMSSIQEELNAVDEELADLSDATVSSSISSGVAGRVKKIYAEKGASVANVMYEQKALMLISVDGYMAVDIETDALKKGDAVSVTTSNGNVYSGKVDSVWAGKATVLITDNGTTYGDEVTVSLGNDTTATGTLYIHESVAITGYAGTISSIHVSENQKISAGKKVITLTDTSKSVNYATLLEERKALEDELQDMIVIYKEGAVYAKEAGIVTSITEADEDSNIEYTTIAVSPMTQMSVSVSVDETDILSLSIGQEATVSVSSLGDDTYVGTVSEINKTGTSSNGVTSYSATIVFDRAEGMLQGMTASAVITIEGKDNALLVPEDAVKKTSSTAYVYTSYDESTGEFGGMVEVTTGLSNGNYIEIVEGLKEGDVVYYQEAQTNESGFSFGDMPMGGGGMQMPSGGDSPFGGSMPSGGGSPFGGSMPSGGGMPSGSFPGRN